MPSNAEKFGSVSIPQLYIPTITSPSPPTAWKDYITQQSEWEQCILLDVTSDLTEIWQNIPDHHQHWIAASDGSYKHSIGSYAWSIHNGDHIILIGTGGVTGNPITAFRTELNISPCRYPESV